MQQGGFGSDDAQEEQRGLIGRASDLAAGLKHPRTAFFHLIFKASAIFSYMFGTWISDSFVNVFIVCVLLLAFDFWTVKNVSGRLMVGLRWWSEVLDDGSTQWRFESQEDAVDSTMLDVGVFWGGLFLPAVRARPPRPASRAPPPPPPPHRARLSPAPRPPPQGIWFLFGLGSLFRLSFDWLLLIFVALCLSGANIIGYVRCKKDAKGRIASGLQGMVARAGMNSVMSGAMGNAFGAKA